MSMFDHLKMKTVDMGSGKNVESTKILDGEAKSSPVENEKNSTTQYSTPGQPKGDLGGRNNLDG